MKPLFDHEKLKVYQRAMEFVKWADGLLQELPKGIAVHSQLDRASTSIPLNIAEGNGKFTSRDRCRFMDVARGSALECAACLDILVAKNQLSLEQVTEGKGMLREVVAMLTGLIKAISPDRVYEETACYDGGKGDGWGE